MHCELPEHLTDLITDPITYDVDVGELTHILRRSPHLLSSCHVLINPSCRGPRLEEGLGNSDVA